MNAEEFRRAGHEAVEWVARYLEQLESFPVLSPVAPGEIRGRFPESPPSEGEPFDAILADTGRLLDGVTHWQSPNFFGYFPANASGPSMIGELVSAALGVQGMLWSTSPACTELETLMLDWLVELLDLPASFKGKGTIQDSASSAALCALVAARHRALAAGAEPAQLQAYASTQTHSSIEKGARIAGLRPEQLTAVATDRDHALDPAALAQAMNADRAAGRHPFFVCATVGTTSSTAIDPVPAIAELTAPGNVWLHVDGAYAGTAAVCPEFRFVNDGLDRADSYETNLHKWLLVNFDCGAFWVANPAELTAALSILPEYLRNAPTESGAVIDYRDWQVPLGRRFRALKVWYTLRYYGQAGLAAHIRHTVALARQFADLVGADPDFELASPVRFSLVCFRHRGGDEANQALMDTVNASGALFLTHTRLDGLLTLRMAVGSPATQERHISAAWEALRRAAESPTPNRSP